jgi:hypothetical protein
MASIEVDVVGLSTLAHRCEQLASRLEAITASWTSGELFQPSAVAVSAANVDIAAACARFASRMYDTAAASSDAASGYAATESAGTDALGAVAA